MKHIFCLVFFLTNGLIIPSVAAVSDADAEQEALARLVHELRLLERLIQRTEANANADPDPDARIRFRYDWLRREVKQISDGVQLHMDAPHSELRSYPSLRGDYRH